MRKPRADHILADGVDSVIEIISEIVDERDIGEHLGYRADAERLLTHFFDCLKPGYVGWHWAITVSRFPRSKRVTVSEIDILPGKKALLAPEWVPWEERLKPGDIGPSDTLPYRSSDDRLVLRRDTDMDSDEEPLARLRLLSDVGVAETRKRWSRQVRPRTKQVKAPASCASCGFLVSLESDLRNEFGVCANEWSNDDGRLVPVTYSCGAHSETDVKKDGSEWPITPPRVNELDLEVIEEPLEALAEKDE
ncbi:MAG: DUF3027 domain-containing protein [Actinomycetaceae bacterium]|nr:DUF3027 domain-containing protein [Actinomycetaceae bacterium]